MGKGKKSSGKHYTSKGEVGSPMKTAKYGKTPLDEMIDKQNAWMKGSNPWITIDNPNKNETNKRKIRVRMNDLKGGTYNDVKKRSYIMK